MAGRITTRVGIDPEDRGGCTPYRHLSNGSTKADVIKASAGQLYGSISMGNIGAAAVYLRIYDKATAPSTSDTPVIGPLVIPGATTGAGREHVLPIQGVAFANGISWRLTTTIADDADTAVTSAEVSFSIYYA